MDWKSIGKKIAVATGVIAAGYGFWGYKKENRIQTISPEDKIESPTYQYASIRNPGGNTFLTNLLLLMIPGVNNGITLKQFQDFTIVGGRYNDQCGINMMNIDAMFPKDHPLKQSKGYQTLLRNYKNTNFLKDSGGFIKSHNELVSLASGLNTKNLLSNVSSEMQRFLTESDLNSSEPQGIASIVSNFLISAGVSKTPSSFRDRKPGRPDMKKHHRNLRRSTGSM